MERDTIGLFRNTPNGELLAPGQTVFKEGDPAGIMDVVQSGTLEVSYQGRPLEQLGEGALFGEMSLISQEPRSCTVTVTATGEARLVPIDLKRFLFLVEEAPFFAVTVMKTMSSRLRKMMEKLDPAKGL
ncbi:MAG TPA: cyclic nucleotide-binding domain-containing protein [Planctomycetota bacterium]|nr:cyclic nucleotide-binding domain-containing protein [Planctomycetota bacterium]